ncbi:lanthionine synthetase LanC family protein [Tissierella praeacuta]|uniref:lanthionine synthetase LanC family protein n=1 Tax=Tissierella praeacuta TaxID=43131 RepID=UPI003DA6C260
MNSEKLFSNIYPRYLFRNTNLYSMILEMSTNPKYLKDKSDLDRLYNLLIDENEIHKFSDVYQTEVTDLFNDDILYFYGCINDGTIYNSNGYSCFALGRTPLMEVNERINKLNQKDMYIQIDFIKKSMTNQKKTWNSIREKVDYDVIRNINRENLLIEAAKNIGDIFLYSGLAGNAVFFSSLYVETKDINYKIILEKILNTIRIDLDGINNKNISAFNGIISLAYLYAFLYNQIKDKNMLKLSLDIVKQYKEKILEITSYDIIDGLAGVLIVVLNIFQLSKDKELEILAIEIGNKIIKNIQIEQGIAYWANGNENQFIIAGFSHGLSGVIYALSMLYELTGYKEYISIIDNLIHIENSYYNDDIENWIDLRREDTSKDIEKALEVV